MFSRSHLTRAYILHNIKSSLSRICWYAVYNNFAKNLLSIGFKSVYGITINSIKKQNKVDDFSVHWTVYMKTHIMYTWMYCRREYNIGLLLWCRGILQQNTFKSTYHQILQCKQSHIFWIWNIHQILMYNEEDTSKLRTVCIVDLIMCLNLLSVF